MRLILGVVKLGGVLLAIALWLVIRDVVVTIGAGTAIALPCVWSLSRLVEPNCTTFAPWMDRPSRSRALCWRSWRSRRRCFPRGAQRQ
jgi:hypothetical protein